MIRHSVAGPWPATGGRWSKPVRPLDPGEYPPAGDAFGCAAEHMASDERQDDRMPLDNGVPAILGKQVEHPRHGARFP